MYQKTGDCDCQLSCGATLFLHEDEARTQVDTVGF
jgi:hypothetical protein